MSAPVDEAALRDLCLAYLSHYTRFAARAPGLLERLEQDRVDFEIVPIPRLLLNQICAAEEDRPVAQSAAPIPNLERWLSAVAVPCDGSHPARACVQADDTPVRIAQQLVAALAAGSVAHVAALLSPDFLDEDARNRAEVCSALETLCSSTIDRTFTTHTTEEIQRSERNCTMRITGNWRVTRTEPPSQDISEQVSLYVLLERRNDHEWKVLSIRSARITS
jgi:hypothetical protein